MSRTDQEILDQTNELAAKICRIYGHSTPVGYRFDIDTNPRGKQAWDAACEAQELLTSTELENVLDNLEDDQILIKEVAKHIEYLRDDLQKSVKDINLSLEAHARITNE